MDPLGSHSHLGGTIRVHRAKGVRLREDVALHLMRATVNVSGKDSCRARNVEHSPYVKFYVNVALLSIVVAVAHVRKPLNTGLRQSEVASKVRHTTGFRRLKRSSTT